MTRLHRVVPSSRAAVAIGVALAFVGIQSAQGALTPISYLRDVMSFATIDPIEGTVLFENDSVQSNQGGIFDETLELDFSAGDASVSSSVVQTSNITATGLFAFGEFDAVAVQGTEADFAEVLGATRIIYRFSNDQTVQGSIFGFLESGGQGVANAVLVGPAGVLVNHSLHDDTRFIDEQFEMIPGEYELSLTASGYGQAFDGSEFPASGRFEIGFSTNIAAAADPLTVAGPQTLQVHPNPMRDDARIHWSGLLPDRATVLIADVSGRIVRSIEAGGGNSLGWDARDDRGQKVPAGIYLVRLAGTDLVTRALVLRR